MSRTKNWITYGRKDDCLTACVARLLNIHYDEVPFYGKDNKSVGWLDKLKIWSNKKGYKLNLVWASEINSISLPDKFIGVGKSPSGRPNDHAVIVDKDFTIVWDPAYNKRRSIKSVEYILVFREK